MFLRIRYRHIPNRLIKIQFRPYSFIDCDNNYEKSKGTKDTDNKNDNCVNTENTEPIKATSDTKIRFSNVMNNFLHSSLDSLENFIVQQAPQKSMHSSVQGSNSDIFEIDLHNDAYNDTENMEYQIPYEYKLLNKDHAEYIDLSNSSDINALLLLDEKSWYKVAPEIKQSIQKTSNYNIPLILNFYIRSLPEIQSQLKNPANKTKVGPKTTEYILRLLINLQWFKSASFIIYKMNLPFNELVNYLNEMIDDELIFQKSNWMRYFFILNFYQVYKHVNPLVISNIDFLGNSKSINKFKILNMIWKKHYISKDQLKEDVNESFEILGPDKDIDLMHTYKLVDIIKSNNTLNLSNQIHEFKKLIGISSNILTTSQYYLGFLIKHMTSFSDFELHHISTGKSANNITNKEAVEFMFKRQNAILDYLIIYKNIQLKSFDCLSILKLKPPVKINLRLWDYNLKGFNNNLSNTVYHKFLIEEYVRCLTKTNKIDEVLKVEFPNLSSTRKIKIITSCVDDYLKQNNLLTRNRVGGYIALTNQQNEHSYVMRNVIQNIFFTNKVGSFEYSDLLKILELISSYSPTTFNKENLFEIGNDIIEYNIENSDFFKFNDKERFNKTLEFIDLIKSIDPASKSYVSRLTPSIVKFFNYSISSTDRSNYPMGPDQITEISKLCNLLNETFDLICENPRYLSLLNPKNYPSKIYLTHQGLLQKLAGEIFKLPNNTLYYILNSRSKWICLDDHDWILKFHKTVFTFGIFLEVLFRRGTRENVSTNNNVRFSNLNSYSFKKALKDEMDLISSDTKVWELVERLSGFEWNDEINQVLLNGKPVDDVKKLDDQNDSFGSGIIMVLNELNKSKGMVYVKRHDTVNKLLNEVEAFDNITDALLDSSPDLSYEEDDILNVTNSDSKNLSSRYSRGLLDQDMLEFNELYQNMKNYENFVRTKNNQSNIGDLRENDGNKIRNYLDFQDESNLDIIIKSNNRNNNNKFKKRYTLKQKERLVRLYSPLRLKCILIESLIRKDPRLVDAIVRRLYVEYETRIPVSLLHSAMIGIINSNVKDIGIIEKINVIKVLDTLVSVIYSGSSAKAHSYLFMQCVRFKEFRVLLVDMIIKESKILNGGSLKTLNWAMKKITNNPNLSLYKTDLVRWTNELHNMKESEVGFWNPSNNGGWMRDN